MSICILQCLQLDQMIHLSKRGVTAAVTAFSERQTLYNCCSAQCCFCQRLIVYLSSTCIEPAILLSGVAYVSRAAYTYSISGVRAGMRCLQQPLGAQHASSYHELVTQRPTHVARPRFSTFQANPDSSSSSTAAQQHHSQLSRDALRPDVVCRAGFGFGIKNKAGGKGSKDCPCGSGQLYSVSETSFKFSNCFACAMLCTRRLYELMKRMITSTCLHSWLQQQVTHAAHQQQL
jgi:hypothetical protein